MKEKIENKLQYIKDAGFELTDYETVYETVDMLSTLIQEERKEAVEGFVKYYLHSAIGRVGLYKALEEYLESEGKE